MYVTFDFRCERCGSYEERFVKKQEMDSQECAECPSVDPMIRLPAGTRTTFRFADRRLK